MENEKNKTLTIPKSEISKMYVSHLGIILSNISIVTLILGVSSLFITIFAAIFTGLWLIFWFVGIIFTVGTIFVMIPNYSSYLTKASDFLANIPFDTLMQIMKYTLPIGIVASIASIILLSLDKKNNHKGRIIFSSIVLALLVIVFVIIISGALN